VFDVIFAKVISITMSIWKFMLSYYYGIYNTANTRDFNY